MPWASLDIIMLTKVTDSILDIYLAYMLTGSMYPMMKSYSNVYFGLSLSLFCLLQTFFPWSFFFLVFIKLLLPNKISYRDMFFTSYFFLNLNNLQNNVKKKTKLRSIAAQQLYI